MTDEVRALLDAAGISSRRLRTVVRLLTDGPQTLASLVGESGADRRSVQAVLAAIGDDLMTTGDQFRVDPAKIELYRELIDHRGLTSTEPVDPLAHRLAEHADVLTRMQQWIDGAPGPRESLDHVSATAMTAVRRALWLDSTFDLDGARLLCVGDHDLTSLALAAVNPRVVVTVVDVDDPLLEYIDRQAQPSIRCLWADLRFGLPPGADEWGDLVFTDPPYTPEGVRLFLARGLATLRDREHARLVMSYGFPEHHPALGLKVQQAAAGLHLAYEAILPGFNRYHGAQAIGSRSDLHVLRPTARSWRTRDVASSGVNIYSHGPQSVEGSLDSTAAMSALHDAAAGPAGLPVRTVEAQRPFTATVLSAEAIAIDLSADPGGWLVRALLGVNAPRIALLVPNDHPDLTSETGQRRLTDLVAAKYRLRLRRSTPGPRHAIVEADRVEDGGRAVRAVVDRAHGKVGNTWREALIRASGGTLTKNDARERIRATGVSPDLLAEPLISLPRHRIAALLRLVAAD
jgi:predicted methyltransferase